MFRNITVFCGLLTAVLLFAAGAGHPAPVRARSASAPFTPSLGFGLDGGGDFLYTTIGQSRLVEAGGKWTRVGIYWYDIQPNGPSDWNDADLKAYVDPLLAPGVNITPVLYITGNPSWEATTQCGPIDTTNSTQVANYTSFISKLVNRYPTVPVWIMYNEADAASPGGDGCFGTEKSTNHSDPNSQLSGDLNNNGVPDANEYAEMARLMRKTVRAVNQNARVAYSVAFDNFDQATCPSWYSCGQWGANYYFLNNVFDYMVGHPLSNGEAYADLIAFNYYDLYGPKWTGQTGPSYRGLMGKAQALRQLMQSKGVNLQLFVTETGEDSVLTAGPNNQNPNGQSQCVMIEMARAWAAKLEGLEWWMLGDYSPKHWYYGLVQDNATYDRKPSFYTFKAMLTELAGYQFDKAVSLKGFEAYQFVSGAKKKLVVIPTKVSKANNIGIHCGDLFASTKITLKAKKLRIVNLNGIAKSQKDAKKGDLDTRAGYIAVKLSAPTIIGINQ